jgi:hypothetical protein
MPAIFVLMEYIKRSDAVRLIFSGELFTAEFVTADEKRGTGGDLIEVRDWQLLRKTRIEEGPGSSDPVAGKMPNHDLHHTVVIHNPANRSVHPITVHTKLIQVFNGKRVLNG